MVEKTNSPRPRIVCLCGSTRFSEAYQEANKLETLNGRIVLTIGCDMRSDADLFAPLTDAQREQVKAQLDDLHLAKIDLADEILVLNVNDYVGDSTLREIRYARITAKPVRWWVKSKHALPGEEVILRGAICDDAS